MSNFNIKLKSNSLKEANNILDYSVFALFLDFIKHLIIQLINRITQVVYSKFAWN